MVVETGRFRVFFPPPSTTPTTSLLLTESLSLLTIPSTPTSLPPPPTLPFIYHTSTVRSLPIPTLLSLPPPTVAVSLSPLASSNTLLLSNSTLRLSVDRPTFHSLGLPCPRALRHPHQRPSASLRNPPFIPIQLPTSNNPPPRTKWALQPARLGTLDLVLSAGTISLADHLPPDSHITTTAKIISHNHINTVNHHHLPDLHALLTTAKPDDDAVLAATDAVQRLITPWGNDPAACTGAMRVGVQRYIGVCAPGMADDAVTVMRELASSDAVSWTAVLARGYADAPLLWRKGRARGGAAPGFDADAAELFLFEGDRQLVVQMRGACDE